MGPRKKAAVKDPAIEGEVAVKDPAVECEVLGDSAPQAKPLKKRPAPKAAVSAAVSLKTFLEQKQEKDAQPDAAGERAASSTALAPATLVDAVDGEPDSRAYSKQQKYVFDKFFGDLDAKIQTEWRDLTDPLQKKTEQASAQESNCQHVCAQARRVQGRFIGDEICHHGAHHEGHEVQQRRNCRMRSVENRNESKDGSLLR